MKKSLVFFLILLLLSACRPAEGEPTLEATPSAVAEEVGTATPLPTAEEVGPPVRTPEVLEDRPFYVMQVALDYDAHRLDVRQTVHYPNLSGGTIPELLLVVEPARYAGVFSLHELAVTGIETGEYNLAGGLLSIPVEGYLMPGSSVQVELAYSLTLPAQNGPFGYTAAQASLHNWFPYFPPRIGGDWLVHPPGPVGEHSVYPLAGFDVTIYNPDEAVMVAGPGLLLSRHGYHVYRIESARTFMWGASPNWIRLETMAGEIPLEAYVYPQHQAAAEHLLANISASLTIYEALFGPYTAPGLAVVEFDSRDGMEADGIFFLDQAYFAEFDGTPKNYLTAIGVHEVCHHWWYGQVGNDQALEPWVDEALCVTCEALYYEYAHPGQLDWWWDFRVHRFNPRGAVGSSIYEYTEFMPYVEAVYMRGALFMRALRLRMGDDAFFAALRQYLAEGQGQVMSGERLLEIMAEHSAWNLESLAAEFFVP
jgi:hypothetical protein